jgi:glutamate racemase
MFDSGVGGLTVLHECLVSLPQEDFLYLGDTAMFPYGSRDPERLRERIAAIAELLLDRGAKLLVIACNTATSIGADVARSVAAERGVEVVPVVEPQAEIAAAITDSGRVGVLATPNTVESGAYRRALEGQGRALAVTEVEAPELAPFIQEGSPFDESVMAMARGYCEPLKRAEVDTLILGCTHYPLVAPMLQRILGRDVRLVSGGHAVAAAVQRTLERAGIAREPVGEGSYGFLSTGDPESFRDVGTRFLQMPLGEVEQVEIDSDRCAPTTLRSMSVLEQVQGDVRTAMKARDRERAGALRMVVDVLQKDAKLGKGDEVAVLQKEHKKRVEAAEAYEGAGRVEQAAAERFEAELIEGYLPQQLSEAELAELVDAAVAETGASESRQMGEVMSALMPKLGGRADGKRVSAAAREKLGA